MYKTALRSVILTSVFCAVGCSDSGGSGDTSSGNSSGGTATIGGATTNPSGATSTATSGSGSPTTSGATGVGGASTTSAVGSVGGTAGGVSTGTATTDATTGATSMGGASATSMGGASATTDATTTAGGSGGNPTVVTVQLTDTHQPIEGFGINDTYGESFSSSVADHLFKTDGDGLGMSILRIGMENGSSLSPSGNVQAATSRGAKIIGSVWTPPPECKSDGTVNDGGHLKTPDEDGGTCYTSWSDTIANFASQQNLYAMSVGNEPDFASCGDAEPCNGNYQTTTYTANQMVAFIKVLGPKLQAAGVKVIAPEASEWIHTWSNESACCSVPSGLNSSDPLNCGFPPSNPACDQGDGYDYGHYLFADQEAWAALDIVGVHQYDTQRAEPWPADVTDKKPVWQTEMSGVKWWPEQGNGTGNSLTCSKDINNGIAVAGWIHDALTVGDVSAWLYWWYKAYYTDDNEGLTCKDGSDTKRHWTFGNYSKFVRPGYTRVGIAGPVPDNILLSGFSGDGGAVVVVAINKGDAAADVPITIAGGTAPASMTPWVTSATDNLVSKDAVAVAAGTFTASLPGKSVTTFVGM